jgi:formate dehydrogenase assembly factor FdhD
MMLSGVQDQDELPQVGSPTMIDVEAKMNQAQLTVAASLEARSAQFQQLYAEALDQQLQQHAEQEAMHQVQMLTPDGAIITVRTDISSDSVLIALCCYQIFNAFLILYHLTGRVAR